jgi:hypothetical protein
MCASGVDIPIIYDDYLLVLALILRATLEHFALLRASSSLAGEGGSALCCRLYAAVAIVGSSVGSRSTSDDGAVRGAAGACGSTISSILFRSNRLVIRSVVLEQLAASPVTGWRCAAPPPATKRKEGLAQFRHDRRGLAGFAIPEKKKPLLTYRNAYLPTLKE